MVPVLTSFLPPAQAHLYLPACFSIWKAFNSTLLDDRFIEMCGELSEEHVSAPIASEGEDFGMVWNGVGIWSQIQWNILVGKGLSSISRSSVIISLISLIKTSRRSNGVCMFPNHQGNGGFITLFLRACQIPPHMRTFWMAAVAKLRNPSIKSVGFSFCGFPMSSPLRLVTDALAKIFVYSMSVDGETREVTPVGQTPVGSHLPKQLGFTAGSRAVDSLDRMITSIESFFHPTNTGPWTISVCLEFYFRITY